MGERGIIVIYPRENAVQIDGGKLLRHLYFDTMADFSNLPRLDRAAPGSDASCVDTGESYILNGFGVWKVI